MAIIHHILNELEEGFSGIEKTFTSKHDLTELLLECKELSFVTMRKMVVSALESLDISIRESETRKNEWNILRTESKTLIASIGEITFQKTIYYHKKDKKKVVCLLDEYLELEPHQNLTEDAVAEVLEKVVDVSYEKTGESACADAVISKETVKNILHPLVFPKESEPTEPKKVVKDLYIEADEDHVALQFHNVKGDIRKEGFHKNNGLISKLIYVHEGKENVGKKIKRNQLINPHYFSGNYSGSEPNRELWDEVYSYIDARYDLNKVQHLYLSSDGGSWILAGANHVAGFTQVLDAFHLEKYLVKATSDKGEDGTVIRSAIRQFIQENDKEQFIAIMDALRDDIESISAKERIQGSKDYILNNWNAAVLRMSKIAGICSCSTEGHVSHVLSDRMSSRPMGWSKTGADKMAKLRAYVLNGGKIISLVRYQKEAKKEEFELPMASGAEGLTLAQIQASERSKPGARYLEQWRVDVGAQIRKQDFYKGICGDYSV